MSEWISSEVPLHLPTGMASCRGVRSGSLGVHAVDGGPDRVWALSTIPSGIQIGLFVSKEHATAAGDIANRITDWSDMATVLWGGQMYPADPETWNPLLAKTSQAWATAGLCIAVLGAHHWTGRSVYAFVWSPVAGTA